MARGQGLYPALALWHGQSPAAATGERYDAGAGLQYLNARYYDPRLGLFLQPDWFEVTEPGVGTNRYAYSGNDPVNLRDPGGNDTEVSISKGDDESKNPTITISVTVGWKGGKQPDEIPFSEEQLSQTANKALSTKNQEVTLKDGTKTTVDVRFDLTFVEPTKTKDLIAYDPKRSRAYVQTHLDGSKTLGLTSESGLGSFAHEIGHVAGMKDHYSDGSDASGETISVPSPGWKGNLMADGAILGQISAGRKTGGIVDARNFNETIARYGRGLTVTVDPKPRAKPKPTRNEYDGLR